MGVTGQTRGSSVLAERAPSEGARSTRAVEDPRARPFIEGSERAWREHHKSMTLRRNGAVSSLACCYCH